MSDVESAGDLPLSNERDDSAQRAGAWTIVALAVAVGVAIGLFGGIMFSSLVSALSGEDQEPGLDNAGNIERRADQLVGEPVPTPPRTSTAPVAGEPVLFDEPASQVTAPAQAPDQRAQERRTLAYESPLTPPVADIAERIRKRDEDQQAAAEAVRPDSPVPGADGVLTNASAGLIPGETTPQARTIAAGTAEGARATGRHSQGFGTSGSGTPADRPRHELYRGSVIAAVLESAIDSDLPGLVRARVTRDVYDSRTGTHLLIPRGSRLIGVYGQNAGSSSGAGGNRRRLFVAWQEMRLLDGTPVALDNFAALGSDGASGIRARRATGFLEALGAAVLFDLAGNATAILTAATGIGQQQSGTGALANAINGALGNSTQRVGADYVGSLLARGPRFRVKAGSFMNVVVEQDLMLPAVGRTKATR